MSARINSSHSLRESILLKLDNKDISRKTEKKIASKISQIRNTSTPMVFAREMISISNVLSGAKNHRVFEKIKCVIGDASLPTVKRHADFLLKKNIQSDDYSSMFDELMMSKLCKSEGVKHNANIVEFSSVDALFSFLNENKGKDCDIKAVTKMARAGEKGESHYACIDVLRRGSDLRMMVYDSAFIQMDNEAGTDHGFISLKESISSFYPQMRDGADRVSVGFMEMGIQRSPKDCAIFSISTANNLSREKVTSQKMLSSLTLGGLTRFYEQTASHVINDKESKTVATLPALFLKHSTSGSGIKNSNLKDIVVNKKNNNLQKRVEDRYVTRNGRSYSNSIEIKRQLYLNRLSSK
ncbi:MAG: hypothetical protein K2Q15_04020 [Burkholderiales bacterium]|nr:hypothetical protein [Burkholderiales bacterium]